MDREKVYGFIFFSEKIFVKEVLVYIFLSQEGEKAKSSMKKGLGGFRWIVQPTIRQPNPIGEENKMSRPDE